MYDKKYIYHENTHHKKPGVPVLNIDKIDFKSMNKIKKEFHNKWSN